METEVKILNDSKRRIQKLKIFENFFKQPDLLSIVVRTEIIHSFFEKNKENIQEWISNIDKDLVNRVMGSVMIESSKAAEYVIDKYKEVVKAKENTNDIKESSWNNRKKDSEMER